MARRGLARSGGARRSEIKGILSGVPFFMRCHDIFRTCNRLREKRGER